MEWKDRLIETVKSTKEASFEIAKITEKEKNIFLEILSEKILQKKDEIIKENEKDVRNCIRRNYSNAFIDRLKIDEKRINKMVKSVKDVISLPDPVGQKIWETIRPNGLKIEKIRVPIGVIGIIYESRPDVTVEASILCIKSGNSVILRGGKEAKNTNLKLVEIIKESLRESEMSENIVNLITTGGRKSVKYLLKLYQYIDLIIPRGGESLIKTVVENSYIPVIKHYAGVCHTYVDKDADLEMAWKVVLNAKVQRPATCNATETLLVHKDIAKKFLPKMAEIFKEYKVEMRGCEKTLEILPDIKRATEIDWYTEYLDLIISIKIVKNLEEAIEHINKYGTHHSDSIITENEKAAEKFLKEVDSAAVYHNASTRFTDGGEFGLGAEIGISTDKIHARGPMGLEELTTYKYIIYGNGQIRE
ncbi:MAG TPA: glutamate-5-semialdehyde dehydrogenase [bacterium]|nr:glutamate-5-semialdehyde dehydrogenase [bacterium]HOM27739.1 glutamate-5-semialdehyde dehydrogenase [bacterium]